MANAKILPTGFYDHDFISMAKKESNPKSRIRMIAMANIKEGKTLLTKLSTDDTGGRITGKQLQSIIMAEFSIKCCLRTVYNILHRLNFSWISSRSKHPKSDMEVQELYKKFAAVATRTITTKY